MPARPDHYATLGVPRTATAAQIKAAFRRLARRYHPDANAQDAEGERQFKAVARAYEVLGEPARRKAYDARAAGGRFGAPGAEGPASYVVDRGPIYHSDLGHHSDFYQGSDPLSVTEAAALVGRDAGWLRAAIRSGRLAASRGPAGYLLRRRDVERLDRTAPRRSRTSDAPEAEATQPEPPAAPGTD